MSFVTDLFKKPKFDRGELETGLRANPPRKLVIGKTANGGDFTFKGLSDFERGDNRDLSVIMVLAGHECNRLTRVWVNGELVHGELFNGQRVTIDDYFDKGSASRPRLWLTYHNGSPDQAADSFLASTNILPVNWTSAARLRGCAYVVATMRQDNDVLQSELTFRFEYEGANLYDRRKDTTAGGVGAHRLNDPSTWEYSDNPAVALDHYRLGIVGGENNDQIIFGMGQAAWQNPYDEFAANADICDEQVFGISRYAFNGRISSADDHRDNISRFATAMAARAYYSGGRLYVRPKQVRPIKITLYDSDLVSGAPYELSVSPGGDDLTNTIKGAFSDPSSKYNNVDYPDIKDSALIAEDGRVFEDTLDLPDEVNEARAQRIATIELEIQKRRDQITETYMPIANVLEIGDWFERVSELRGAVTKIYEVIDIEKGRGDGHVVTIVGQETDSGVTAFGENQAVPIVRPDPLPPLEISRPDPPSITALALIDNSGGASLPAIRFTVTPPSGETFDGVSYFEVQYGFSNGLTGDDLGILDGEINLARFDNADRFDLPVKSIIPNAVYAYRVRTITNRNPGNWGPFQTIVSSPVLIASDTATVDGTPAAQIVGVISDNADGVADLVTTYGNTVSSAQSAADAAAAQSAAELARDNSQTAQNLAETAQAAAEAAETNAAGSATAAANSESAAGASETAAGQSAAAASTSELNAATSEGNASASESSAATSASNAAGSESAAAQSATLAANSETAAGQSANAAAASASTASTKANEAGVEAAAAATSAVTATTAADASGLATLRTRPSTFEDGGKYFTDEVGGDPTTIRDADESSSITPVQDSIDGAGLEIVGQKYLSQKGVERAIPNNVYKVSVNRKSVVQPSGTVQYRIHARLLDENYQSLGALVSTIGAGANTTAVRDEREFILSQANYDAGARWVRAETITTYSASNGTYRVFELDLENATERKAAEDAASASAASAASASAAETAAGQFATSSQNSENIATTKAAEASASQGQAAVSESNALGFAAAASSSQVLAAQAKDASQLVARNLYPTTFEDEGLHFVNNSVGDPDTLASPTVATYPLVEGRKVAAVRNYGWVAQRGVRQILPNKAYEVSVEIEKTESTGPTRYYHLIYGLTENYAFDSAPFVRSYSPYYDTADGKFTTKLYFTTDPDFEAECDALNVAAGNSVIKSYDAGFSARAFFRVGGLPNLDTQTSNDVTQISSMSIREITGELTSRIEAKASATSAASASASETAAGQFAASAQSAENTATTKAAEASAFRDQAAASQSSAAGSAAAASASESLAAAAESDADQSAQASAQSAASASASETAAVAASADAQGAASSAVLASEVSASLNSTSTSYLAYGSNAIWNDGASYPKGWALWNGQGTTLSRETSITKSGPALRMNTNGVGDCGILTNTYSTYNGGAGSFAAGAVPNATYSRYIVVEAWAYLVSGDWKQSGVYANFRTGSVPGSSAGTSFTNAARLHFFDTPNAPVGKWVKHSKFFDMGNTFEANADGMLVYQMANWSGLTGGGPSAKDIIYGPIDVRAATEFEVDARVVLPAVEARVSVTENAVVDLGGQLQAAQFGVEASTGDANTARMTVGAKKENGDSFNFVTFETDTLGFRAANGKGFTANGTGIFKDIPTVDISADGEWMKVDGVDFGANNDLLYWFGPNLGLPSNCTRQNGNAVNTSDGEIWQFGAKLGGTAVNTNKFITTAGTVTETGIGSNGNVKTVTASHNVAAIRYYTITGNHTAGTTTFPAGSATVEGEYRVASGGWQSVDNAGGKTNTGTVTQTLTPTSDITGNEFDVIEEFQADVSESEGFLTNSVSNYEARAIGSFVLPSGFVAGDVTEIITRITTTEPG